MVKLFKHINLLTNVKTFAFFSDARHFQLMFLGSYLMVGIMLLNWEKDLSKFLIIISTAILVQAIGSLATKGKIDSIKSALITSFGLCLMCKTNLPETAAFAALIAIGSKFIIRHENKHIFNPVNIGIIGTILLTGDA